MRPNTELSTAPEGRSRDESFSAQLGKELKIDDDYDEHDEAAEVVLVAVAVAAVAAAAALRSNDVVIKYRGVQQLK